MRTQFGVPVGLRLIPIVGAFWAVCSPLTATTLICAGSHHLSEGEQKRRTDIRLRASGGTFVVNSFHQDKTLELVYILQFYDLGTIPRSALHIAEGGRPRSKT